MQTLAAVHPRTASPSSRRFPLLLVLAAGAALLMALLLPHAARAGGWATITTTEQPSEVRAGEPTQISLEVLQHGQTAIDWATVSILATNPATGETTRAEATPGKTLGSYVAEVTFPSASAWTWEASIEELAVLDSIFQPIAVHATDAAVIGITQSNLDTSIAPLASDLTDLQARVATLEGNLTAMSAERDALRTDLAALRADADATEQMTIWLVSGLIIVSALLLAAVTGGVLLLRREPAPDAQIATAASSQARWRAT